MTSTQDSADESDESLSWFMLYLFLSNFFAIIGIVCAVKAFCLKAVTTLFEANQTKERNAENTARGRMRDVGNTFEKLSPYDNGT